MKKTIIIYAFASFLQFVFLMSCADDDCGTLYNRFRTVDITVRNLKLVESDPSKGYYSFQSLSDQEVVGEQDFYIELSPVKEHYNAFRLPAGFSLVEKAYACSPLPTVSEEKITGISITADKNLNADYPAGEELVALFDVVVLDYYQETKYQRMSLSAFLAQEPNITDNVYLVLNTPPATADTYHFEIVYSKSLGGEEKHYIKKTAAASLDPDA